MSKLQEISVLMVMGAVVMCCLWVVGAIVNMCIWSPDHLKDLPAAMWAFAGGAWTILTSIGGAMVINVLSTKQSQQVNPSK